MPGSSPPNEQELCWSLSYQLINHTSALSSRIFNTFTTTITLGLLAYIIYLCTEPPRLPRTTCCRTCAYWYQEHPIYPDRSTPPAPNPLKLGPKTPPSTHIVHHRNESHVAISV